MIRDMNTGMDNMIDAIISITGVQHTPTGQQDKVSFVTSGYYGFDNGRVCVSYEESDLTGMGDTLTTFSVTDPMQVILRREGETNSEMIFRQGQKHFILCDTPDGSAALGVDTRRVSSTLNEHGGEMEIAYDVDLNNTPVGRSFFKINVKERNYGRPY